MGQRPVDTAEEAAVRRRRRWKEGGKEEERGGSDGRRAAHCGGQSALTATAVAEWDLSRPDRWTDRATPRRRALAAPRRGDEQTNQTHARSQKHLQYTSRETSLHTDARKTARRQRSYKEKLAQRILTVSEDEHTDKTFPFCFIPALTAARGRARAV